MAPKRKIITSKAAAERVAVVGRLADMWREVGMAVASWRVWLRTHRAGSAAGRGKEAASVLSEDLACAAG